MYLQGTYPTENAARRRLLPAKAGLRCGSLTRWVAVEPGALTRARDDLATAERLTSRLGAELEPIRGDFG
jgi:hypothetical protein